MEVLEAIRTRRSVRDFTSDRIPEEHIEKILDAARYAPSAENLQMWRYIVIREDLELKNFIAEVSIEKARESFNTQPYEVVQGRLWYIPEKSRHKALGKILDESTWEYIKRSDTIIVGCATESFIDSHTPFALHLFGSVSVAMGALQMWLVAHSMGYGVSWISLPIIDNRHRELICERIGIPRTWEPLVVMCIGVPKQKRMLGPSRFPLESVAYTERWGNPYKRLAFRDRKNTRTSAESCKVFHVCRE